MNEPLGNLMKDEIEEAKREAEEKAHVRVLKMMARKFFAQGQSVDYIAEFIEVDIERVEKWLEEECVSHRECGKDPHKNKNHRKCGG